MQQRHGLQVIHHAQRFSGAIIHTAQAHQVVKLQIRVLFQKASNLSYDPRVQFNSWIRSRFIECQHLIGKPCSQTRVDFGRYHDGLVPSDAWGEFPGA